MSKQRIAADIAESGSISHAERIKPSQSWLHPQAKAAVLKASMASFSGEDVALNAGRSSYNPDFDKAARDIVREYVTRTINAAPAKQEDVKVTPEYELPKDLADKARALQGDHPHVVQAIANAARKAEFIAIDYMQDLRGIPLQKEPVSAR